MKHFYNTADFSQEDILKMIDLARKMKKGDIPQSMRGKSLAALFFNPSLRTRMSFLAAMQKLGGITFPLDVKEGSFTFEFMDHIVMNSQTQEHIKEAAKLLSRYVNGIAVRSSELITISTKTTSITSWEENKRDIVLKKFMEYATVPVINMESNIYHPCQGLGDAMTIQEKLGSPKGKKYVLTWTYHPKALPMATPNSEILASCNLGMNVTIAHPKGWELDQEIVAIMEQRAHEAGGDITVEHTMEKALEGADIVCAKSWGALSYYGKWGKEKQEKEHLTHWIVDSKKMAKTNNALFMHCLPVRRNVEVTDEVIDSKNSVVIDQAENRMWAQMALLHTLLAKE